MLHSIRPVMTAYPQFGAQWAKLVKQGALQADVPQEDVLQIKRGLDDKGYRAVIPPADNSVKQPQGTHFLLCEPDDVSSVESSVLEQGDDAAIGDDLLFETYEGQAGGEKVMSLHYESKAGKSTLTQTVLQALGVLPQIKIT